MDQENEVKSSEEENKWVRFGYMLLFLVFYSLAEVIVGVIVFVQFILVLFTNTPNGALKEFGQELGIYVKEIIGYVTYHHDHKVYPFQAWKKAD